MRRIFFGALLIMASQYIFAEPVYLECQSEGEETRFEVALDEATRQVTHSWLHDPQVFTTKGFFGSKKITYMRLSIIGPMKISSQFEIDRQNLELTVITEMGASDPAVADSVEILRNKSTGQCVIQKISGRKF